MTEEQTPGKRKPGLLFLVHRIPFPPNKGDKIRSFNMLAYLAQHYQVHLGCFIDDPNDRQYIENLGEYCVSFKAVEINPSLRKLRSLTAVLTGDPLSVPFYASSQMQAWVDETIKKASLTRVVCFSSPMAQFIRSGSALQSVMDFVDVDSDKWRQYAERAGFPMRLVYRREWRCLAEFERQVADQFLISTFVTANEVSLFDDVSPGTKAKHFVVRNGVDTEYLDPATSHASPYPDGASVIVFVGMMDYWANVEAVAWFAKDILPMIKEQRPDAEFWIVGGSPTADVQELDKLDNVVVTGRVEDVRPYMQHAAVAVAPLRIARGVQNKVLEYLSMGTPTVCSTQAAKGLEESTQAPMRTAESAEDMAAACLQLLDSADQHSHANAARRYVMDYYNWHSNLADLVTLIERDTPADAAGD